MARLQHGLNEAQRIAHMGHWDRDIKKGTIIWSDEIYRIFGLQPQEFEPTYEGFLERVHPDDRARLQEAVDSALKSGKRYSFRHRVIRPEGGERIVMEHGKVEYDRNGKPLRMLGTMQDITHSQKKAEALIRQAETLNSVTDSIFVHDLEGNLMCVNQEAFESRGMSRDEMLSKQVKDLDASGEMGMGSEFAEQMRTNIEHMKLYGSVTYETRHRFKDGRIAPVEVRSQIITRNNQPYVISVARDITERKKSQRSLEESEKKYRNFVENSLVGIYKTDLGGNILYANDAIAKILEFESVGEFLNQNILFCYKNPKDRQRLLDRLRANGSVNGFELTIMTKHWHERFVLITAKLDGGIISGMIVDITETKKARDEVAKLSMTLENIDDIVMISDRAGMITYVNNAYVKHTGFSRAETIGQGFNILKSGKHGADFYYDLWNTVLEGRVYRGQIINRKKNGEIYYEEKTITPIRDRTGTITTFVSTAKDITDRVIMQRELEVLATTDKLTGICNRHRFEELFEKEVQRVMRYNNPLSLLMLDIDHFKKINDTFGHGTGDRVLSTLVNVVQEHIRNVDVFARWGGEEFVIFVPETGVEGALVLAEKLCRVVREHRFSEVQSVSVSVGVSSFVAGDTLATLLKRADQALYRAKENGRNRVEHMMLLEEAF